MENKNNTLTLDQVDNTNGHELTIFAAELLREINGDHTDEDI